jgi:hypothetical protein
VPVQHCLRDASGLREDSLPEIRDFDKGHADVGVREGDLPERRSEAILPWRIGKDSAVQHQCLLYRAVVRESAQVL